MKKEKLGIFGKVALILGSIVEVFLIVGMVYCGLKWFGNLLEAACNYVNVGLGIFMICIVVTGIICIDSKNSIEQYQKKRTDRSLRCHDR